MLTKIKILVQSQVRHCPFASTTTLVLLADFNNRNTACVVKTLRLLKEVERCHGTGETRTDDDEVVAFERSHIDEGVR